VPLLVCPSSTVRSRHVEKFSNSMENLGRGRTTNSPRRSKIVPRHHDADSQQTSRGQLQPCRTQSAGYPHC
jgi:hypothetical protein